jgi:hypothetical protein
MDLEGLRLRGIDGDVGLVDDLIIDEVWVVRYLVVRSGSWFPSRVVVSPIAVTGFDWVDQRLDVRLTGEQIQQSPDLLAVEPITRWAEEAHASYYGFAAYWGGPDLWAWAGRPGALDGVPPVGYTPPPPAVANPVIRRARSVRRQHLAARDGEIGHIDDCIIDDDSWKLAYFAVETSDSIGGGSVLVPTARARDFPTDREITVDLTMDVIRAAPEYDVSRPLDSLSEGRIRAHYALDVETKAAPRRVRSESR